MELLIDDCLIPAHLRRPLQGARWWDDQSLWVSHTASTVFRPVEEAVFERVRAQCHDYEAAMLAEYPDVPEDAMREAVANQRASFDVFALTPVARDAVWGRPPRWLWEEGKRGRAGYWVLNPEWSDVA